MAQRGNWSTVCVQDRKKVKCSLPSEHVSMYAYLQPVGKYKRNAFEEEEKNNVT